MKKAIILFFCIAYTQTDFAQNKNYDSLKNALTRTDKPAERFNLLVKILENDDGYRGNSVDSSSTVSLLKIAQDQKSDAMLATSYNWIGYYFAGSKGDNTTALDYYFKALPLAEKAGDKRRISSVYFDIATIYKRLNNNEEFLKYTLKGGSNLPDKSSPMYDYMLIQFQRNMGNYFYDSNQLDSASFYAEGTTQTSRRLQSINFSSQSMILNANIQSKMGEHELAEIYYKKGIALSDSMGSELRKAPAYPPYINFLIKNNRLSEANLQTQILWDIAKRNSNQNVKLEAAGLRRQMCEKFNQTDSAYYFSRMEANIKDSIFNQDNLNTIQALAFKEQLRMMEDTAKKSEEEQQRNQNIQFALIAFGIISFLIIFLLLSRSFITNTKMIEFLGVIALLIVFEFLNLLLHPFLERVTHHSPVLMLLSLVCIAALLVPMHHKIEHWATHKLVEKNKAIRLTAAKKTIEQLEKS